MRPCISRTSWRVFPFLGEYFHLDHSTGRLTRKDKSPPGLRGVARQYRHFRRCFLGDVLFFQVGKFIEFYQPGDVLVAAGLGLQRMAPNRRGARFGFPLAHSGSHLLSLLAAGRSVTLIGETGRLGDGVKERAPRYRFESRAQMPAGRLETHGDAA